MRLSASNLHVTRGYLPFCTRILRLFLTRRLVSKTIRRKLRGNTSYVVRTLRNARMRRCEQEPWSVVVPAVFGVEARQGTAHEHALTAAQTCRAVETVPGKDGANSPERASGPSQWESPRASVASLMMQLCYGARELKVVRSRRGSQRGGWMTVRPGSTSSIGSGHRRRCPRLLSRYQERCRDTDLGQVKFVIRHALRQRHRWRRQMANRCCAPD